MFFNLIRPNILSHRGTAGISPARQMRLRIFLAFPKSLKPKIPKWRAEGRFFIGSRLYGSWPFTGAIHFHLLSHRHEITQDHIYTNRYLTTRHFFCSECGADLYCFSGIWSGVVQIHFDAALRGSGVHIYHVGLSAWIDQEEEKATRDYFRTTHSQWLVVFTRLNNMGVSMRSSPEMIR